MGERVIGSGIEAVDAVGAANEWSRGWRALVAGFVAMAMGWNFAHIVASLFLKPMQADFGWTRTELAFGPMAGFIVALLLPLTGHILDRFGPRRVAIAGFLALTSAFLAMAVIPKDHLLFYAAVLWMGIAGSLCNSVVLARGVAPWFERNFGLAIGLMMTGASVSGALLVPLLAEVIGDHGWRTGFVVLAALTAVLALPMLALWFREPKVAIAHSATAGQRDPLSAIARTAAFWQVLIASFVAALPIGGFIGHLVPMLTDRGLSLEAAAGFASIFAIAIGTGRIVTGILLDRLHPPLVTCLTLLLAAGGTAILHFFGVSASWSVLALSIILIGVAQGAEGDYIKFFSMRLFGLPNFARVVAIMAMTISLGMALGGVVFAKIFDEAGSYAPAVAASIFLYAVGGFIFASIRMNMPLAPR